MLKNYVKTVIRSLLKNQLTSFINIAGLSVAIGCSMVVYSFVNWQYKTDSFHVNKDKVFYIKNAINRNGETELWGFTPAPLGPMIQQDFPQVKRMVRIERRSAIFRYNDLVFNEFVQFTDPEFMHMFSFPIKWGSRDALFDNSKIILSESMAVKYFGDENPVGKQITTTFSDGIVQSYEVGAVLAEYPKTASFRFRLLVGHANLKTADPDVDYDDWSDFITATFIEFENPEGAEVVSEKMAKYLELQNAARPDWPSENYLLHPLSTVSRSAYQMNNTIIRSEDPTGTIMLSTLGTFLLILACFNYINISIVSATNRLKEIGVRKVIGGSRRRIIGQFLVENLVITFIAMVLGLALGYFLIVPGVDNMFSIGIEINLLDPSLWIYFVAVLLVTGLGSGAYPAIYISSYRVVEIFRGRQRFGSKNLFTKIFLTFQYVLALVLVVTGIAFTQNAKYQQGRDWGYGKEQVLGIRLDNASQFEALKNQLSQNPDILNIVGSNSHIGQTAGLVAAEVEGELRELLRFRVGENYHQVLGLRLVEGRFFNEGSETDFEESIVVNDMFIRNMNWESGLGKSIIYDSTRYNIVGVVSDFHHQSFNNKMRPAFFKLVKEEDFRYLSCLVAAGSANKTADFLESTWKELYPDLPYNGFFQDEVFESQLQHAGKHGELMAYVAAIAIVLACMGLFGLVSLRVAMKMKDFSIKKVLGAGVVNMINGVNSQFMGVLVLAIIIGGPLSFIFYQSVLEMAYAYHMPIVVTPVLVAVVLLVVVALLTVSSVVYKVVVSNPVDSLRTE